MMIWKSEIVSNLAQSIQRKSLWRSIWRTLLKLFVSQIFYKKRNLVDERNQAIDQKSLENFSPKWAMFEQFEVH